MNTSNIHYLIGWATLVAIFAVLATASVLNHMSEARKAKYLAQVCARHISAAKDTEPQAELDIDL